MSRARSSVVRAALSGALLVGLAGFSADALAAPIRVISADAKGVTLKVTVGAWTLSTPGRDGRARVSRLDGAHMLGEPGRPMLPAFAATLAIPPGARPSARVLSADGSQSRDGIRLAIAGKPVFRKDPDGKIGLQPAVEAVAPIVDGPWPPSSIQLAAPFAFRGRRFVQLEVRPFRYDESGAHVTSPLTLTVRVDFNAPSMSSAMLSSVAAPDPQLDAAIQDNVLNWDQGAGWRTAATSLRSRPNRTFLSTGPRGAAAAPGFDEDQPEVRVKLPESALYKLSFDDLAAKGYPANVPVGEVSVHRHEFIQGASPPYGTVELPCEVQDTNGNGIFDSGDAVWVWVQNWAERSQASQIQRYWGDAEVVFVTSKLAGGLRVAQRPGWNGVSGLTPIPSFPWRRHFEKDIQFLGAIGSEVDTNIALWHWTPGSLYYTRPDTIQFATNDLDTTHAANFTVRWVGRAYETHIMWAGIRNARGQFTTVIGDSVPWYGKQPVVKNVTVPGSVLTEGNTNFFRQWGKNAALPPDPSTNNFTSAGLDWFEVEYWRQYRAIQDYVRFNSTDTSGAVQMSVNGFSGDSLRVYDVTDPGQPVRLTIDPAHEFNVAGVRSFEMQDVVTPGLRREYVAACQSAANPLQGPLIPPSTAYSVVTRRNLWSATSGDYLLVVPEAFLSTVSPLESLRRSQGLSVLEAPVENIYDEFNGGRHSPAAIQRFTKYAYAQWNSRFLTLLGTGTLDPNGNVPGSSVDWIPVLPTPAPVTTTDGFEVVPSDNRFGFITGNEDPISSPDTNRVVPELMVGRITAVSAADAATQINKIVAYENVLPTDTWRKNVLLNADDAYSGNVDLGGPVESGYCHRFYEEFFVGLNQTMHGFISSDSGVAGMNVEEFNLRYYLPNESINFNSPGGDTCRNSLDETQQHTQAGVTPILIGKLNNGQLLWNFQGHANEYQLTHENLIFCLDPGGDALRLANDNKPFIFTAFSCHANSFGYIGSPSGGFGRCLGDMFMKLPNGRGAVSSWASVSFEVVPRDNVDHVNVELIRSMFVNPPRDEFLGADDRGSRVIMGECVLSALFRYLGTVQSIASERGLSITYTLLGDPATRVSIGRPIGQVLANQLPVTSGTPVRLHTLGDTLRIDADVVSNSRIDSLAFYLNTGAGDVVVPPADYTVTPPLPDTAAGSVFGGRHFKLVYHTIPAPQSQDYAIVARDRYGLSQRIDVTFQLDAVLRSGGTPINDNDEVAATADLSLLVLSPAPLATPLTQISLKLNGNDVAFTAVAAPGDPSGREWILSWVHPPYPIDEYTLIMTIQGGGTVTRRFRVTAGASKLALQNLIPFPNPFDNDGTHFSFVLLGTEIVNLKIHVFTQAGKSIYTGEVRGLAPGYHQIAWDGHDAEGDELANGIYFYRVSVTAPSGATTQQLGKLVKLRKPHHVADTTVP
jgi:hypothetical protein